ncbi:unnamed protein product, partial [Prorocentrum cordatum]
GKTAAVVSTGPPAESRLGAMNTPQDSMNLRVKRRGTTAFVLCYPEQPVLEVKEKIGKMFDREVNTFRLLHKDPWRDRPRSARSRYRRTTWCTWCSRRGPGAGRTWSSTTWTACTSTTRPSPGRRREASRRARRPDLHRRKGNSGRAFPHLPLITASSCAAPMASRRPPKRHLRHG